MAATAPRMRATGLDRVEAPLPGSWTAPVGDGGDVAMAVELLVFSVDVEFLYPLGMPMEAVADER